MNAALKREYRTEDQARRFRESAGFLTGTITSNEPGGGEPIDLGVLFKSANDYMQAEYKKAVEAARYQRSNQSR